MLLFPFGAFAFASLAPTQSAVARPIFRCFAKDGCREDAVPVQQAILSQPITEKDLAAVKDWVNQGIADLRSQESGCRAQHKEIEEAKEDALDAIDSLADDRRNGRVIRKEQRMSKRIEDTAKQAHSATTTCVDALQIQIARLQAMAGNPELLRAEVSYWRAEQYRQAQAAIRGRQIAEARPEADRKRREADVKTAAERQAAAERTRERQRMAAVLEERERQAVAAPGGPTQDLQRLVRFVSTWTQPWMVSEELTPVLVVLAGLAPQGFEEWRLRLVSHREANRIPEK